MKKKRTAKRSLIAFGAFGNHKKDQTDGQNNLHSAAETFIADNGIIAEVRTFSRFKELTQGIAQHPGKVIMFTNFPPDDYLDETEKKDGWNGFDPYSISRRHFKTILKGRPDIHLRIITGARRLWLSEKEIRILSPGSDIKLLYHDDPVFNPGFYEGYSNYIFQTLQDIFKTW